MKESNEKDKKVQVITMNLSAYQFFRNNAGDRFDGNVYYNGTIDTVVELMEQYAGSIPPSAPTEATEVETVDIDVYDEFRNKLNTSLNNAALTLGADKGHLYIFESGDPVWINDVVEIATNNLLSQHAAKELAEKDKRIKYLEDALQDIADSIDCIHEGNGDIKQEALNAIYNPNN